MEGKSTISRIIGLLSLIGELDKKITQYVERIKRKTKKYLALSITSLILSFLGVWYITEGIILWLKTITNIEEYWLDVGMGVIILLFTWCLIKIVKWREKTKAI